MGKLEIPLAYGWEVTERCFGSEEYSLCKKEANNCDRVYGDRYFLEFKNRNSASDKIIVLIMANPSDAGKKSHIFNGLTNDLYYVSDYSVNLFLQSIVMRAPLDYGKVAVINMYPHIESNSDKLTKEYKSDEIVENNFRIITAHLKKYARNFDIYLATGLVDAKIRYDSFINNIKKLTDGSVFGIKLAQSHCNEHIHQRIDTRKQVLKIRSSLKQNFINH